jgi:hypothetical protein
MRGEIGKEPVEERMAAESRITKEQRIPNATERSLLVKTKREYEVW